MRAGLLLLLWGASVGAPIVSGRTPHCCVGSRGRQGRWPSRDWVCSLLHARGAGVDSDWPLGRRPLLREMGRACPPSGPRGLSARGVVHFTRLCTGFLVVSSCCPSGQVGAARPSPGERCRLTGHVESARGAPSLSPLTSGTRRLGMLRAVQSEPGHGRRGVPWPCALCSVCFSGIRPCPRGPWENELSVSQRGLVPAWPGRQCV